MKLPPSLTTVTPLSKILALFLLILCPIVGFYLGMQYQKRILPININQNIVPSVTIKRTSTAAAPSVVISPSIREVPTDWVKYANKKYPFAFRYPSNFSYLEPPPVVEDAERGIDAVFYSNVKDRDLIAQKCVGKPKIHGYRECFVDLSVFHISIEEFEWNFNKYTDSSKRDLNRVVELRGWESDKSVYLSGTVVGRRARIFNDKNNISAFVDYSGDKYVEITIMGYDSFHGFKDSNLVLDSINLEI